MHCSYVTVKFLHESGKGLQLQQYVSTNLCSATYLTLVVSLLKLFTLI